MPTQLTSIMADLFLVLFLHLHVHVQLLYITHIMYIVHAVCVLHLHVLCNLQLTVYVLYKEIEYGRQLKEFIAGFRITVDTIEEFLPSVKYRLNDLFYDANSFAEAYSCK